MNRGTVTKKDHNKKTAMLKKTQLLCIGINQYSNDIATLNNAVRDAQAFEKVLKEKYGVTEVVALYDEAATLENILNAFDSLRKTITEADNLIIYFSGHGELVNNRGYWIPVDAVADKRRTYLANHEIKDLLFDLKAHHILVIADACFSGALLERSRSTSVQRYYVMPSRWVMTSGQIELVPDGLPGYHSPFAKSLLTQLALNPKPHLSIRELWLNMREGITANSRQTPLCEPVREVNHQGGEYYFIDKNTTELPPISEIKPETLGASKQLATTKINENEKLALPALKETLRELLSEDETKTAYKLLLNHLKERSSHTSIAYLRLSAYNRLQKNIAKGIAKDAERQEAEIKNALDYIIQHLKIDDLK